MSTYLIEVKEVYKQYPNNLVLNNVNLNVKGGEIHAIIGDNGAGKTTFIRLLAGLEVPTKGTVKISKKRIDQFIFKNKVSYAGQDVNFIDDFSVRQNIVLGDETVVLNTFINWEVTDNKIQKIMDKYKIYLDLNKKFNALTLSEQRKVALLRALYKKPRILVLDEPTVGLPLQQAEEFLPIFKSFIQDKITVIFSTRSKEFAKAVANNYSLLKKGKIVWTKTNNTALHSKKIQHKNWTTLITHKKVKIDKQKLMLYVEDISFKKRNYQMLENIDLTIQKGEILGVYDNTNASSSLIADIIVGKIVSPTARIFLENQNINNKNQIKRYNLGIELVPENFLQDAIITDYSLIDNFILWHHSNNKYLHAGVIRRDEVKYQLKKIFQDYKMPSFINANTIANTLSNGELQKFTLARTLENNAKLIILVNPFMHLDDDSAKLIIKRIIELQIQGTAFLLIDCDPYILELLCNRVSVIQNGRVVAVLEESDIKSSILNSPLTLAKKSDVIIDRHIQIAKSELEYKNISKQKWHSISNKIFIMRDKILNWFENIRVRISGG